MRIKQMKPIEIITIQLRYEVETSREILRLRKEGESSKDIAEQLGITATQASRTTENMLYNSELDLQRLLDIQRKK